MTKLEGLFELLIGVANSKVIVSIFPMSIKVVINPDKRGTFRG